MMSLLVYSLLVTVTLTFDPSPPIQFAHIPSSIITEWAGMWMDRPKKHQRYFMVKKAKKWDHRHEYDTQWAERESGGDDDA